MSKLGVCEMQCNNHEVLLHLIPFCSMQASKLFWLFYIMVCHAIMSKGERAQTFDR